MALLGIMKAVVRLDTVTRSRHSQQELCNR